MLPKIDVPIYSIKLLSNKKDVRFRPFSVKEEKLFLMANESEDFEAVIDTVKQILNNCILDDIDIEDLPMFDLERLFLNIRARSVSEIVDLKYKCNNKVTNEEGEEKTCGNIVEMQLNVLEIEPVKNDKHTNKIEITENLGIIMKYPSLETLKQYNVNDEADSIINMTVSCIDYIYDKDSVYYAKDATKEELVEFLESMQTKDLDKIREFYETMPRMKTDIHFKCSKCGHEEEIEVEGIENFFV